MQFFLVAFRLPEKHVLVFSFEDASLEQGKKEKKKKKVRSVDLKGEFALSILGGDSCGSS